MFHCETRQPFATRSTGRVAELGYRGPGEEGKNPYFEGATREGRSRRIVGPKSRCDPLPKVAPDDALRVKTGGSKLQSKRGREGRIGMDPRQLKWKEGVMAAVGTKEHVKMPSRCR